MVIPEMSLLKRSASKALSTMVMDPIFDAVRDTVDVVATKDMPKDVRESMFITFLFNDQIRNSSIDRYVNNSNLNLTPEGRLTFANDLKKVANLWIDDSLKARLNSFDMPELKDETTRSNVLFRLHQPQNEPQRLAILFGDPDKAKEALNELIQKGPLSLKEMYDSNPSLEQSSEATTMSNEPKLHTAPISTPSPHAPQ